MRQSRSGADVMIELRFRLRLHDEIVGYMRTWGRRTFYSKDGFWWTGTAIPYLQTDRFSGWFDKNRRPLYEGDFVSVRDPLDDPARECEVASDGRDFRLEHEGESVAFPDRGTGVEFLGFRSNASPS